MPSYRYLASARSVQFRLHVFPYGRFPHASRTYNGLIGGRRRAVLPTRTYHLPRVLQVVRARTSNPLRCQLWGRSHRLAIVLRSSFAWKFSILLVPFNVRATLQEECGVTRQGNQAGRTIRTHRQITCQRNVPHITIVTQASNRGVILLQVAYHGLVLRHRLRDRFCDC